MSLGGEKYAQDNVGLALAAAAFAGWSMRRQEGDDRRSIPAADHGLDFGRCVPRQSRGQTADGPASGAQRPSSRPRRMRQARRTPCRILPRRGSTRSSFCLGSGPAGQCIKEVKDKGKFVAIVDRAPSTNDSTIRDLYVAGNIRRSDRRLANTSRPIRRMHRSSSFAFADPIDQQRQDGFDKGIAGSNVKVLDRQFGNWKP